MSGMIDVPAHVQTALSIAATVSEDDLSAAAAAYAPIHQQLGLSGGEFVDALSPSAANLTFHIEKQKRAPSDWRYLEISYGGSLEQVSVFCPGAAIGIPATAPGQLLARAWIADASFFADADIPAGTLVFGRAPSATNAPYWSAFAGAWIECCLAFDGIPGPCWVTGTQLGIDARSRLFSTQPTTVKYFELLIESVSENKAKWRFLSLYRILEHGYLSSVYQELVASFFGNPKESLDAASDAVGSEFKQFLALAKQAALEAEFGQFFDEFDNALKNLNPFAHAIKRSMQASGQLNQCKDRWQNGVLVFYKIRCAIVHAGAGAPMYDGYPGAPQLLESLLPIAEKVVLSFLAITIA